MNSDPTNQESNHILLSKLVHSLEVKQDSVALFINKDDDAEQYHQGYFDALEYIIERLIKEYSLRKEVKDD